MTVEERYKKDVPCAGPFAIIEIRRLLVWYMTLKSFNTTLHFTVLNEPATCTFTTP